MNTATHIVGVADHTEVPFRLGGPIRLNWTFETASIEIPAERPYARDRENVG